MKIMDQVTNEENKINNQIVFLDETLCDVRHRIDELWKKRSKVKEELKFIHSCYEQDRTTAYLVLSKEEELSEIIEEAIYLNEQMYTISKRIDKLYEEKKDILSKK